MQVVIDQGDHRMYGPLANLAREMTVIIPAYQAKNLIVLAVESALDQSEPSPHVIVVDDGSTDGTADLVGERFPEVEVIAIPHQGEASARNAGLKSATSDWVAFLDADDRYLPGRLLAIADLITKDQSLDAVTTDAFMEVQGEISGLCYGPQFKFALASQPDEILKQNFVFGHVVVRRQRLLDLGGYDESILHTTDWAMWADLILSGGRIGFVDEPLSIYKVHTRSSSADRIRMSQGSLRTLRHIEFSNELDKRQQELLAATRAQHQSSLGHLRLTEVIESESREIRSRARNLVGDGRLSTGRRIRAAVALVSPRLATVVHRHMRDNRMVGTAGWLIPAESESDVSYTAKPLVSVILPFLDEERFLADSVGSVQDQTMTSWELLLVDDGSTDGSAAMADEFAAADPARIRVVRHAERRNRGLAASRNLGLANANGATTAFLDADDLWDRDKLEVQLRRLAETPEAGMVTGPTRHRFLDLDRDVEIYPVGRGPMLMPRRRLARELVRERIPMPPPPSSVLYRTGVLRSAGGVPAGNSTYEDQRTFVAVSLTAPTLITDDVLSTYTRRSDSVYGRLANDNVEKSKQRRQFEWWVLRTAGERMLSEPRALSIVGALVGHRTRVAVSRRLNIADRLPRRLGAFGRQT